MPEILQILKDCGAVIMDGHFVYTSGKHGSVYVNKDVLYPHTQMASEVGRLFAEKYKNAGIEVVVGPMLGGIILSQWTAHHLTQLTGREVLSVYTEKDEQKNQIFSRRRYDKHVAGKKTLIVEDVTNTGGSAKKVIESVQKAGGNIVALCVMINRNPKEVNAATMGAPFDALGVLQAETYEERDCPLCQKGIPVNTEIGHGKEFLQKKS